MTLSNRLDRMVSFRLSEEEYKQFRKLCLATKARSISEMARAAVRHWLTTGTTVSTDELHRKIVHLEQCVAALTAQLEGVSRSDSTG